MKKLINKRSKLIIPLILFSFFQVKAQDTFNIFFGYGLSSLSEESKLTISSISKLHYLADIDSICFFGMTDSSGTNFFNNKLALKRAKNAADFFSQTPKNSIPTRVISKGEVEDENFGISRRVCIIVYFKQPYNWLDNNELDDDAICYYIAYELLQKSLQIKIGKGKNKKIRIITEHFNVLKNGGEPIYYYGWFDSKNNFKRNRVKFTYKITGKLWWRKRRYVAEIPYESYKLYKIFSIGSEPCANCNANFAPNEKFKFDSFLFEDHNLMNYLQYKKLPWHGTKLLYRVPLEFVDNNSGYYESCDTSIKISWQKPKQDNNNKKYYAYTTVTGKKNYIPNIVTYKPSCRTDQHLCDSFIRFPCGGTTISGRKYNPNLFTELAYLNGFMLRNNYLGLGLEVNSNRISHKLLINQTFELQPFFKYQTRFDIFKKFNKYIKPTLGWTSVSQNRSSAYYAAFYLGAQFIVFSKNSAWTYNPFLIAGLEFYNLSRVKIFAQTGILNAYLVKNGRNSFFDYVNLGFNYLVFK